jgi:hypothetical protein
MGLDTILVGHLLVEHTQTGAILCGRHYKLETIVDNTLIPMGSDGRYTSTTLVGPHLSSGQ